MSARQIENLAGVLGSALAEWAERDPAKGATAAQIRASNLGMAAVDDALSLLHKVRSRLVTERRADQDARAVRVDAMLAASRETAQERAS